MHHMKAFLYVVGSARPDPSIAALQRDDKEKAASINTRYFAVAQHDKACTT